MKRFFTLALAAIMLFSMTACGAANMNDTSSPTTLQNPPTVSDPTVSTPTQKPSEPTEPTMSENVVSMMVDDVYYEPHCYQYPYSNYSIIVNFVVDPALYPGRKITLDVTIDNGFLARLVREPDENGNLKPVTHKYYKEATLDAPYGCYWRADGAQWNQLLAEEKPIFVDAVIRADGNIVGYCLYEINFKDNWYMLMRSEMMLFPMVDGQLQYISEEYIADIIAQRRAIVTPVDLEAKKAEYEAWWQEQANKKTEP